MKRARILYTLPNGLTIKQAAARLDMSAHQLAIKAKISPTTALRLFEGHPPRKRAGVEDRLAEALNAKKEEPQP